MLLQQEAIFYLIFEPGRVYLEDLLQLVHVLLDVLLLHLLLRLQRGAASLAPLNHREEEAVPGRLELHRDFGDVGVPLLGVELGVDLLGGGHWQ